MTGTDDATRSSGRGDVEGPLLGVCPTCETAIPRDHLLIMYDRAGERTAYAACPSCAVPVRPESRATTAEVGEGVN